VKEAFTLAWRVLHLPKQGHSAAEYEDAFAGDPQRGRFAVADGASESAFAGPWARLLVGAYVQVAGPWSAWLPAARKQWRAEVQGRELPWYAEAKVEEGAYAALLGMAFEKDRWQGEAVGDSCLFQVRDGQLRLAFPIRRSADFGNRPSLLGSRRTLDGAARTRRLRMQGSCQPGDRFLLMTDALAQWFLTSIEAARRPWDDLHDLRSEDQFARWLEKLRSARALRNDDVTLIQVESAVRRG
jgi:hypothetical protein